MYTGHSGEVLFRSVPKLGTERHGFPQIKLVLQNSSKITLKNDLSVHQRSSFLTLLLKYSAAAFCSKLVSLPQNGSEQHLESKFLFFVAVKGILSCVLSRRMVWNRIPRICIYFGSTEWNSDLCSVRRRVQNRITGSLLLFLFHGTELPIVFSSAEGFETEFRDFLFRGTTGIPSAITICLVYSIFREISNRSGWVSWRRRLRLTQGRRC